LPRSDDRPNPEMPMNRRLCAAALPLLMSACAVAPTPVPDALRPGPGEAALVTLAARGVQIYECRAKKDDAQATEWAFVAPEADLFDRKHYAGPRWEAPDGSKALGSVKARADAPAAGAIPWLLLTTRSDGPDGAFAKVTSIQRVRTVGGVAPASGCTTATIGQGARVPYTADYVLFAMR
jgi:Protein of unknown function (DUF3455)